MTTESKRKRGPDAAARVSKTEGKETRWDRTKSNVKTIGGAVVLAFFIRIVLFEAFEIEGPSMEPTLLNGDRVVVAKFMYGLSVPKVDEALLTWSQPSPGDVVIVNSPHDGIDIVKRVIGVPGDVIEIRDDVVYRNGDPIRHEEIGPCEESFQIEPGPGCEWIEGEVDGVVFRTSHDVSSPPANHPPIDIREGYVYILGDHRDRSNDSRFFGPVQISRVKGKALMMYWSSGPTGIRWERIFDGVQ
ncbi:MAG: signal peptidase I [Myxococcota bacterium]